MKSLLGPFVKRYKWGQYGEMKWQKEGFEEARTKEGTEEATPRGGGSLASLLGASILHEPIPNNARAKQHNRQLLTLFKGSECRNLRFCCKRD